MSRFGLALAGLIVLLLPTDGRAQDWQPFPSLPRPAAAVDAGQRMSLGLRAEQFVPGEGGRKVRDRGEQCRKWRRMADRLGETYAGHALRTSVLREVCGMLEPERASEAWDWPWSGLARGRIVPPRHVRTHGAWELRCGTAGQRRRCAILAALGGPGVRTAEGEPARPVAHFVIDTVAGRETLLWRLFVPAERGTAVSELGGARDAPTASDASFSAGRRGSVRYKVGEREHAESFPLCVQAGCLMEASVARGGTVATLLWEGRPLDLVVEPESGRRLELQLPAAGFRAAFAELLRLRREERRGR